MFANFCAETLVLMRLARVRSWLIGAWCCVALLPAHDVGAHGVSLDFHHALPAESGVHRGFVLPWVQKVEEGAGGRMRFHLHPAAAPAGAARGLYAQVAEGETDVVWAPIQPTTEQFQSLGIVGLPLLFRQAAGGSRAVSEFVRVNDLQDRDLGDVRTIAVHVGDGSQLHWGKATESAADVKGRRVAVESPEDAPLIAALGAVPVEMPAARIAEAVRSQAVDGVLMPWSRVASLGIDRVVTDHTDFGPDGAGLTTSLFVLAMNPASYRGLADDLKAVVNANSGSDTAAWLGRVMDETAAGARKAAITRGDTIRVLAPSERERWRQAVRPVVDARTKALEQAGVRVGPLLESLREQLKEFDGPR